MAEVTYAFGAPPAPDEHQQKIINILEEALADARSGIVEGIAIVAVHNDMFVCMRHVCLNNMELIGALGRFQHRLNVRMDCVDGECGRS